MLVAGGHVPAGSGSQDSTRARCRASPPRRHLVGSRPFPQRHPNGGVVTPGAREKGMSHGHRKAARRQEGATVLSSWSWAGRD